jgi:Skp family chaperone for outer membrane proteins
MAEPTQELIFTTLLNEANQHFTPHFFGNFENSSEEVAQKKIMFAKLSATASDLKKKYLEFVEKIQPKGQKEKLYTQREINDEYQKFNEDIEKRNELLNADTKTKEELKKLQQQINDNETKQTTLNYEIKKLKETSTSGTSVKKPEVIVDTSDPGVILQNKSKPIVAKMKINIPAVAIK